MNEKLRDFILSYKNYDKAADALGVSVSSISCWIRNKRKISLVNCMKIEKLTNGDIKMMDLRPELFGD